MEYITKKCYGEYCNLTVSRYCDLCPFCYTKRNTKRMIQEIVYDNFGYVFIKKKNDYISRNSNEYKILLKV